MLNPNIEVVVAEGLLTDEGDESLGSRNEGKYR